MRTRSALVAALAVVAVLAGCAAIPDSGAVKVGNEIDTDTNAQSVFNPRGPQKGESQSEIVQDFIQAQLDPQNRYETARKFLTASWRDVWKPDDHVTIRVDTGSTPSNLPADATKVLYEMSSIATVDADGTYVQEPAATQDDQEFELEKEDGEWRISKSPNGVVIGEGNFDRVFAAHPLFFFDPTYQYLVPDVRWFATTSTVSTSIANALVAGPAAWLGNGVLASAIPAGTTLAKAPVIDGSAIAIALSDEARDKTSDADRTRMLQQLRASLTSSTITGVSLTVGGVALSDPGTTTVEPTVQPPVNSTPLVRQSDAFGFVTVDGVTPLKDLGTQVVAAGATGATYAIRNQHIAVRGTGGVSLVSPDTTAATLIDPRAGLVDPSIDNSGYVWSVVGAHVSTLIVLGPDNQSHGVSVASLESDARVVSMDVSRDGTRLLLYLDGASGPSLVVAGIVRAQDGRPTALNSDPVQLPIAAGTPIDATWENDRTVAAISEADGERRITEYAIGGPSDDLGLVVGATQIVGGNAGETGLRVLDSSNTTWRWSSGTTWRKAGYTASFIATQQPG